MSVLPNFARVVTDYVSAPVEVLEREGFCDYAYDFVNNQLLTRDNKHYYVYGNEAMKIWIFKAIISNRFKHSAYSDRFGSQIHELIGEVISRRFKEEEIKRYIIEAVMVHPFMVAITRIDLRSVRDGIEVDVYYRTIFEDKVVKVSCTVQLY